MPRLLVPCLALAAAAPLLAQGATSPAAPAPAAPPTAAVAPVVPPPDDAVVDRAIEVLQRGDAAARGAFIHDALSPRALPRDSARVAQFLERLQRQGAPFVVAGRRTSGRNVFVQMKSERAARTLSLQLATDRADPRGLGIVDILEAHPTVLDALEWPTARLGSDTAVAAVIDRNVRRLADADAFAGTIYVAHAGRVVLARGYGLANREDSVPNSVRTRFAMASMGKMFTATAVMQLVARGRLSLDDTLGAVLPEYPNEERRRRVTIRQLLEHSAGLGDQWTTERRPVPGLTGALATVGGLGWAPLLFDPGSRFSYSNEGYNVLAAVVEKLTGETIRAYVQREVFNRAGMVESVMAGGSDDFVPWRAVGYRPRLDDILGVEAPRANWSFVGTSGYGGAGGGYTTVGDLARFADALRSGRLIPAALRDGMWTGRWDIPGYAGQRYGMGFFVQPAGSHVAIGHGGGGTGAGMDNGFRHFTDGSWTVAVLTNIEPPAATVLTEALVQLVARQ